MKKGQGLSLNVIIVAALALIVLVILVAIFTGRLGVFDKSVGQEGDAQLIKMRIQYGDCMPTLTSEADFKRAYSEAENVDDKAIAQQDFERQIKDCKAISSQDSCSAGGCRWS